MSTKRTAFGLILPQRATLFGAATWEQLLDLARMADRHELFESVWVGDSAMAKPRPDSLPLLGALSAVTTRVRLGVGCMASFALREPVFFAEQWSTLDFISKGRMQLVVCTGIGLGGTSAREGAVWDVRDSERGARMAENIEICRRLWSEEQTSFAGTFRSFGNASVNPKPVQRPCPIWIAANPKPALSGKPLRRVAEIADGWMVAQVWPGLFSRLWERLSKHLVALGKDPRLFPNIAYHNIHLGHDRATALAETRRFLHEYYGSVFSAEQAEGWTAAGMPPECVEDLNRLVRAGAKAISLRVTGWNQREQFDQIAAEVLPHVDCQPSGGL